MNELWQLIVAIVGAGGGAAVLGVYFKYLLDRNRQRRGLRKDEFENLQVVIDRLNVRIDELESECQMRQRQHEECLEQNLKMRQEANDMRLEIMKLKSAVEALQRAQVSMIAVAMIFADETGTIIDANAAAHGMFHYRPGELMGQKITVLMPRRYQPRHARAFKAAVDEKRGPKLKERLNLEAVTRTGEEIAIDVLLSDWEEDGKRTYMAEIRRR